MSKLPIQLALVVLLFFQGSFPSASRAAQHVILCPADLAAEFQVLADHRTDADVPSIVVTLEDVLATARPGVDDAETIRNFLVDMHAAGELRYVLLGGDLSRVPSRTISTDFYPAGVGTDLDVDLYYAGLDGTWDADGDGIFGEPYRGVGPDLAGDDADLEPDVALGRAPVANADQARRFVDGVIAYDTATNASHLARALLLADVIFPGAWSPGDPITLDGATYARAIGDQLLLHPSPILSMERFENPDLVPAPMPLTRAAVLADLDAGTSGFVYFFGSGAVDAMGIVDELIDTDDLLALTNAPDYAVHMNILWAGSSLAEAGINTALVTAPAGGACATFGFSDATFPVIGERLTNAVTTELTAASGVPVGDAWAQAVASAAVDGFVNTAARWGCMTLVLFGDPAMPFRAEAQPVSIDDIEPDVVTHEDFGIDVHPNPAHGVSAVRFSMSRAGHATVRVFDVRGRAVDTLFEGRVDGPRAVAWDTESLPHGIYFVQIETGERVVSRKVTITR